MRDNKGLSFNLNLNKYCNAYVINDESRDKGRYKDLSDWGTRAEPLNAGENDQKQSLKSTLNKILDNCQKHIQDKILQESLVTFYFSQTKGQKANQDEWCLEKFIKEKKPDLISSIRISYTKQQNFRFDSLSEIGDLPATTTTKRIFEQALRNVTIEQYNSFFKNNLPKTLQLAFSKDQGTRFNTTNAVIYGIFYDLNNAIASEKTAQEKIKSFLEARRNRSEARNYNEKNINLEVKKYFSAEGYNFIQQILLSENIEDDKPLKISEWKAIFEKSAFSDLISTYSVKDQHLFSTTQAQEKKPTKIKSLTKKTIQDLVLEITKNLTSENDVELNKDKILEKVAEVWVGLAWNKVEKIQTALGSPTAEKTTSPGNAAHTAELVKIVGIEALIAEINHNIPTLFEEQKQDIVEQLAYLTEIDQIQKYGVTHGQLPYALKNPSLEKFKSYFFNDEFVKETLLKENGENRFLSADQFRIVKDFEAALFDIAYPRESSHRKPFVDLDTGEGKTFSIELLKKISNEILQLKRIKNQIDQPTQYQNQINHLAQDKTQIENLENLVNNFSGIVPINLANQSKLDSIQRLQGKIIIIDESRFIPGIEGKMKNLVHRGAKVIRVGASQNPAIVLASKFRQEAKLQEIADEEGESDKKKNLKGKIDESERRYAKMLERRAKAESDLQLVSNTSFTNTASDQANSAICTPQNWGEIGWKTSGKEQAQSNAQYLLINKAFDSAQDQETLGNQLQTFAHNSNVDFAVVNFIKDDKHACLVFQKGKSTSQNSVTPYWLEPNQDSTPQSFGEEKSADQKNPKTYEEFKKLSEGILKQENPAKRIATIYAGSPNFTVGGDYGTISILGENNPQEIVIAPDQNLTFDHLKQALGRNRQTDPKTLSERQIHVYAPEENMEKFFKKIENQTFEQDLLELLEFFNSKAELAVWSHSKQTHTKPNLDQIYQRIISGKELYDPKNKRYTDIGELGLDQNNEKLFSVNRALINQGFFNTAFSKDENGKLLFNYAKILEELKKKGEENEDLFLDLDESLTNSREEKIPVSTILDQKGFLEHLLKISTPSYGKNTIKESQIKAQSEKEALEERLGEMETSLRQVKDEKNSLLDRLEELQNQNNELSCLGLEVASQNDKLSEELKQEKLTSEKLTSENQELLGKISELTSEKEDLERENSKFLELPALMEKLKQNLNKQQTNFKEEKESEITKLQAKIESQALSINRLGTSGEELIEEKRKLSESLEEYRAHNLKLTEELKLLSSELESEETKTKTLQNKIEELERNNLSVKKESDELRIKNKFFAASITEYYTEYYSVLEGAKQEIVLKDKIISELEEKIKKITLVERSSDLFELKLLEKTRNKKLFEEQEANKPDWSKETDPFAFEVAAKDLNKLKKEYVLKRVVINVEDGKETVKPILFNPSKQEERSDKFRFLKIDEKGKGEIDEESESEINGEENLDTKAKELIKLVVKSTIKDFEEKKIPHKDFIFFIEAIIKAKDQGQSLSKYADTTEGGDKQLLKAFSAQLQKNMAANGIFSGRTKGLREDKLVGLRSHFIAEEILKELKDESQETETKTPNSEVRARESEVKSFLQAKAKIEVAKS